MRRGPFCKLGSAFGVLQHIMYLEMYMYVSIFKFTQFCLLAVILSTSFCFTCSLPPNTNIWRGTQFGYGSAWFPWGIGTGGADMVHCGSKVSAHTSGHHAASSPTPPMRVDQKVLGVTVRETAMTFTSKCGSCPWLVLGQEYWLTLPRLKTELCKWEENKVRGASVLFRS